MIWRSAPFNAVVVLMRHARISRYICHEMQPLITAYPWSYAISTPVFWIKRAYILPPTRLFHTHGSNVYSVGLNVTLGMGYFTIRRHCCGDTRIFSIQWVHKHRTSFECNLDIGCSTTNVLCGLTIWFEHMLYTSCLISADYHHTDYYDVPFQVSICHYPVPMTSVHGYEWLNKGCTMTWCHFVDINIQMQS